MNPPKDLHALLSPESIAVVGASDKPGAGSLVIDNLRALGFTGEIIPVNPGYREVRGLPCYPSLADVPAGRNIDCAALVLGAGRILPVLEQAAERGVGGAWAFASGFSETGESGKALQARLKSFCDRHGIAFCGPNCVGYVNLHQNVGTFSAPVSPTLQKGPIGAVVQSGSVALALANSNRGIGFSTLISSGNEAVLDTVDYLEYFLSDPHTRVIIIFLEGIRRPQAFQRVCVRAAEMGKPIVCLKVGRSELARRTVTTHTGALAGGDAAHQAFFDQFGVTRVDDLDQLMETAAMFSCLGERLPRGNRVGVVTVSGGEIGLIGDLSHPLSLDFPPLSSAAEEALREQLPPYTAIGNPLDAWGSGDLENTYPSCLEILAGEDSIDLIAVSQDSPQGMAAQQVRQYEAVARAVVRCAAAGDKPVVVFSHVSGGLDPTLKSILDEGGVPFLQGTRESLSAIEHLVRYAEFQKNRCSKPAAPAQSLTGSEAIVSQLNQNPGVMTYREAKEILEAYGIGFPKEFLVHTADQARDAARRLGYPLVLKGQSQAVPHKTEAGLVFTDIRDESGLLYAFSALPANLRAQDPEAELEGILIQEMIQSDALEMILGIHRDPVFGPTVVLGLGGIFVELLRDLVLRLPPVSREEALAMIGSLKGRRLLQGFRGRPRADIEALAEAVVKVARLAVDLKDGLRALDLNPLMVLPAGRGVVAVDVVLEGTPMAAEEVP